MRNDFITVLKQYPVIAAAKDCQGLKQACNSNVKIIFILFGDIIILRELVSLAKTNGKIVFVHMDLIEGLVNKEISVRYIKEFTKADGIISTKSNVIKAGNDLGLMTVQRFFMLDSMALEKAQKHMRFTYADAFEILPGVMPKIIQKISLYSIKPIIAGGLIMDKEDSYLALDNGATAISTTKRSLWNL
ncbi:MAG: glycerol-3-phosphate responsive antiterminator [Clostridium sp.]|jgi:glycerol uptake operon antiterminator|nr:glycerol-3-phosphate responsive antiterminator [Clostridium sp.]